jgi:hypothetical protein
VRAQDLTGANLQPADKRDVKVLKSSIQSIGRVFAASGIKVGKGGDARGGGGEAGASEASEAEAGERSESG